MGRWRMAMLSMPVSMSVPVPLVLVLVECSGVLGCVLGWGRRSDLHPTRMTGIWGPQIERTSSIHYRTGEYMCVCVNENENERTLKGV